MPQTSESPWVRSLARATAARLFNLRSRSKLTERDGVIRGWNGLQLHQLKQAAPSVRGLTIEFRQHAVRCHKSVARHPARVNLLRRIYKSVARMNGPYNDHRK